MVPTLDERAWLGTADCNGTTLGVELFESRESAGYYHCATFILSDEYCHETRRPMNASLLQGRLDLIVDHHDLDIADVRWQEVPAANLPLSGERVRAGK